jgi:TRAP-type mannitol/chloroaromatic compound transport system substrate-binding protein
VADWRRPQQEHWEMTSRLLIGVAAAAALVLVAGAVMPDPADAQERIRWKMQSAFPSTLSHLGTAGVRFSNDLEEVSQGTLRLEFFEPGALVPALECFDAASQGSVEACWTTPGYHTGKIPALAFFTAVPFGPTYGEFFAWLHFGGGHELKQEIYNDNNIHTVSCFAIGPETSGWFREEVASLESLRGLKMRFFGLGAQVMQKLGVNTQLLAGGDIYPALERGVIDATEFSMPAMDIDLGFYQVAKFNYFPGWHQMVSIGELLVHKPLWDELSDWHKKIIEVTCNHNIHVNYAETEENNPKAMQIMVDQHGVQLRRWTDEELGVFEEAWREVVEEESARDPIFARVAESYFDFRARYKVWGDAQILKATYLD